MLITQGIRQRFGICPDGDGQIRHVGNFFNNNGGMRCIPDRWTPAKRRVSRHEYRWREEWIHSRKPSDNDLSCIPFVAGMNLFGSHYWRNRNSPTKIIRMRGAEARYLYPRLRPSRRIARVRMNNALHTRKGAIQR